MKLTNLEKKTFIIKILKQKDLFEETGKKTKQQIIFNWIIYVELS